MTRFTLPSWATYCILFVLAFVFVLLFSCTTSPMYEHYPFWFHGDSGIFQEMGVCLVHGGTPYVDLFDHKGPILWFIQALGIWISPKWGIMALQSLFLFFSLLLWNKSTLLLTKREIPSIIIPLLGLLFLIAFYERGNLCEEWSLPFISLPIYLYLNRSEEKHYSKQTIYKHIDAFTIGLCVGIIAMIRLNNTAPIVGFVLWHFLRCIQQKEFRRMWIDVALIIGGMAIIFVLCSAFYLFKAGWFGVYEMFYGTFIYNLIYYSSSGVYYSFLTKIKFYVPAIITITAIVFLYLKRITPVDVAAPLAISCLITVFAIGRFFYGHYLMILIPLIIDTTCLVYKSLQKYKLFFLGCIIIYCFFTGYSAIDCLAYRLTKQPPNLERHEGFKKFVLSLSDEERKSIYNAGLNHIGHGLFAENNIYQCNRIISDCHSQLSSHLHEYENTHGIKDLQPLWVLTQSPRPEATDEYLIAHYTLADSIPGGEFDPIWCWRKNP